MKLFTPGIGKKINFLSVLFSVAFIFNLIWENIQKPLFVGQETFLKSGVTCYLAAFGDALIIVGIYFLIALIRRKYFWFFIRTKQEIVLLVLFGFISAILFEKFAIATERWEYTALMPILPLFKVGLVPVLQMLVLPFLTLKITQIIIK